MLVSQRSESDCQICMQCTHSVLQHQAACTATFATPLCNTHGTSQPTILGAVGLPTVPAVQYTAICCLFVPHPPSARRRPPSGGLRCGCMARCAVGEDHLPWQAIGHLLCNCKATAVQHVHMLHVQHSVLCLRVVSTFIIHPKVQTSPVLLMAAGKLGSTFMQLAWSPHLGSQAAGRLWPALHPAQVNGDTCWLPAD